MGRPHFIRLERVHAGAEARLLSVVSAHDEVGADHDCGLMRWEQGKLAVIQTERTNGPSLLCASVSVCLPHPRLLYRQPAVFAIA